MAKPRIYRIAFLNEGKLYEIYASEIAQSNMMGFIEISGLLFGERGGIVVDPTEERLRSEFDGVDRTYVPIHSIVRIDEVEKRGTSRIAPASDRDKSAKVTSLPLPDFTPKNKGN